MGLRSGVAKKITQQWRFVHNDEYSYDCMLAEAQNMSNVAVTRCDPTSRTIELTITAEMPGLVLLDLTYQDNSEWFIFSDGKYESEG